MIEAYRHAVAPRSTLRRDTDESGPDPVISAREEKALSRRVEQLLTFLDVPAPQPPSQTINIRRVSDALGLGALAGACGGIKARQSGPVREGRLILALRRLNGAAGRRVGIHDVRDCVTVADSRQRIDAILDGTGDAASFASRDEPGLPRVAVASDTLRHTSLDTISYSLMHGRDTMRERLAVVTGSKAALVAALRGFLAEPHAPRPGLTRGSILSPQNASAPEPALMEGSASADILDEWARYWVSNRSAKLRWSSLHRGDTPARVPLPAYPFELKRIRYTARDLQQSATTMPEQTPDRNVPVELPLPGPTGHPVSSSKVSIRRGAGVVDRPGVSARAPFGNAREQFHSSFSHRLWRTTRSERTNIGLP